MAAVTLGLRSLADVANDFAQAAGELYAHPDCPLEIANLINEIEGEAYNASQRVSNTPELQAFRFRETFNAGFRVLVKSGSEGGQGEDND